MNKFKKVVILDSVILYPEHRALLNTIAQEVVEYPSSLPENLDRQYTEHPEMFKGIKCYTELATNDHPLQLLMNRVDGADVIVSCWTNIPDEILCLNKNLKLILFWTHEKEHRINMKLADELGIVVNNVPDYGTDSVAEVVFAGWSELIKRNFADDTKNNSSEGLDLAVLRSIFEKFRKLATNEKNTRAGKFSHHFHKLGLVEWNFDKKTLDDMIPEKLVEGKRVGLENIKDADGIAETLKAFNIVPTITWQTNANDASYYKAGTEQDLIFFDSTNMSTEQIEKSKAMFGKKFIDINTLDRTTYRVDKKVFGIVGLGRIGRRVAEIANRLGFKVVYYSKERNVDIEEMLKVEYRTLEDVMRLSDVVSIHLPAHKAENLITAKLINSMKKESIFINTADGNAVDQYALTHKMVRNEVYAYLDVYAGLPRKDILGMPMKDATDWKIHDSLPAHIIAYRSGWKTQESIRVKTYKLLGEMMNHLSTI